MKKEDAFSLQTFIFCFIIVGALVGAFYFAALHVLEGISQQVGLLTGESRKLPTEMSAALSQLAAYVSRIRDLLIPSVFGPGALAALIVWAVVQLFGRRAMRRHVPPPVTAMETALPSTSPSSAMQMLSILQRRGRLIDFLEEDLTGYSDEQVGAAVRNIHQGCKEALFEHVELKPIMNEEEGARVTVAPGFDVHSLRLTGNVVGDPPFQGILRHHGWRAVRVDLPQQIGKQEKDWIVDPAEVEVNA